MDKHPPDFVLQTLHCALLMYGNTATIASTMTAIKFIFTTTVKNYQFFVVCSNVYEIVPIYSCL